MAKSWMEKLGDNKFIEEGVWKRKIPNLLIKLGIGYVWYSRRGSNPGHPD